jgi:hypothetical protein
MCIGNGEGTSVGSVVMLGVDAACGLGGGFDIIANCCETVAAPTPQTTSLKLGVLWFSFTRGPLGAPVRVAHYSGGVSHPRLLSHIIIIIIARGGRGRDALAFYVHALRPQ